MRRTCVFAAVVDDVAVADGNGNGDVDGDGGSVDGSDGGVK